MGPNYMQYSNSIYSLSGPPLRSIVISISWFCNIPTLYYIQERAMMIGSTFKKGM